VACVAVKLLVVIWAWAERVLICSPPVPTRVDAPRRVAAPPPTTSKELKLRPSALRVVEAYS
jgi:hypothetical protein